MDEEARGELPFLWMDSLPGADGRDLRVKTIRGEVAIGRSKRATWRQDSLPAAICHHWVGTIFIPNVRLIGSRR